LFGVDDDAIGAVVMNLMIVEPSSSPGWLAVKPTDTAPVTSLIGWYQAGVAVRVANQALVTPDQDAGTAADFWIQTSVPTHVIVDISGAFLAPEATALDTDVIQGLVNCSAGQVCGGTITCGAGYKLTGGGAGMASWVNGFDITFNSPLIGALDNTQAWRCEALNSTGAAREFYCTAICSRVPGR